MTTVLNRYETWDKIRSMLSRSRLVTSRYNDGEYILMNNLRGHVAEDVSSSIGNLLIRSIKVKDQFVCINYLKEHNIKKKDIWYTTHNYLKSIGEHEIYGCGGWITDDFCNGSYILSDVFSGRVLLVTGWYDESITIFKDIQPNLQVLRTPINNASDDYAIIRKTLFDVCTKYDTILFSCGPLSKVLLSDLIDKCTCNLVDVGAVINAILGITDRWPMSWVKTIDIEAKRKIFFSKLKGED